VRVITYTTTDPDVPEGLRCCARIRCAIPTKGGKTNDDWHPVVFHGPDAEALREQAQAWWDAEVERAAKAAGRPRGRPKKAEPAPTSIADEAVI